MGLALTWIGSWLPEQYFWWAVAGVCVVGALLIASVTFIVIKAGKRK